MPDADSIHYRLDDLKLRWRQDPSSRLFLQLADEHRKLSQHEQAIEVLEQGLEHRPNDLSALVALGRCRLELERVEAAVEPLETVLSRDPTHIVASKLLIEAHLQLGDATKAADRLLTYRLLNDRDPELDHLEYRLQRLRSEDEEEASTVVAGELAGELEDGDDDEDTEVAPAGEVEETVAEAADIVVAEKPWMVRPPASGADLFDLSGDLPPAPDLGALWEHLARLSPTPAEPFGGLSSLGVADHWDLLSQEGIFDSPGAAAADGNLPLLPLRGNGGTAAVTLPAPELEAPAEDPPTEPILPPAAVAAPEMRDEPTSAAAVESEAVMAPAEPAERRMAAVPEEPEALMPEEPEATLPEEPEATLPGVPEAAPGAASAGSVAEDQRPASTVVDTGLASVAEAPVEAEAPVDAKAVPEASAATEYPAELADTEAAPVAPSTPVPATPDVESAPPSTDIEIAGEESATATLGELYLKQGHREEAERIFNRVLAQDPGNHAALEGLERLGKRRSKPLSAADLLAVRTASGRIPEGLTAKKVLVLDNYVKHIRAAAQHSRAGGAPSVNHVP